MSMASLKEQATVAFMLHLFSFAGDVPLAHLMLLCCSVMALQFRKHLCRKFGWLSSEYPEKDMRKINGSEREDGGSWQVHFQWLIKESVCSDNHILSFSFTSSAFSFIRLIPCQLPWHLEHIRNYLLSVCVLLLFDFCVTSVFDSAWTLSLILQD